LRLVEPVAVVLDDYIFNRSPCDIKIGISSIHEMRVNLSSWVSVQGKKIVHKETISSLLTWYDVGFGFDLFLSAACDNSRAGASYSRTIGALLLSRRFLESHHGPSSDGRRPEGRLISSLPLR